ncbi:MAG: signal peptidase [Thermoleophilia bacterium]|nr:signal peptidase [Thermoleophilia bacterium]
MKVLARGLKRTWLAFCMATLIGALALFVAWRFFDLAPIAVRSGSMSPKLPIHTLLFVAQVPAAEVERGDVITFDPPGVPPRTTHRVVSREWRDQKWFFVTQGDANDAPDDWRRAGQSGAFHRGITYGSQPALVTVAHVPHVGRLADLALHPRLRVALLLLPLALLALHTMLVIWRPRPTPPVPERARERSLR